jgi:hypothetical protein
LEIRQKLRPQLPPEYHVFVESESAIIERDEPCELFTKYTLLIRRAPKNHVVAALEIVSPSNKGISSRVDREKYFRKRESFLEAAVNFLEIDALREGERLLPAAMKKLAAFERNAWTAAHNAGNRRLRGYGWNAGEPLPEIRWEIEEGLAVTVDLAATFRGACEFNRWEEMV